MERTEKTELTVLCLVQKKTSIFLPEESVIGHDGTKYGSYYVQEV